MKHNPQHHSYWMKEALIKAKEALFLDEVPIGAILISPEGKLVASEFNRRESESDPCGHAEINLLRIAGKKEGDWRLNGYTLYVTLEPCIMCLGAMLMARIDHLIFGAYDYKAGAFSHNYLLHQTTHFNHRFKVTGGIMGYECGEMLTQFFQEKRREKKKWRKRHDSNVRPSDP